MSPSSLARLQTPRLVAERLEERHHAELCRLLGDPRVGATLGGVRSAGKAREILARHIDHWEQHGFGLWAFRDRAAGAFVGRGGLQHTMVTGREEVEVAWAVVPERWGAGLATEIASASLQAAFGELGLEAVVAYTMTSNAASRRVMEKAGFTYERDIEHAGLAHVLYRLRASEWAILGSNQ